MTSTDNPLVVYGVPFSQPVRAVLWLLLYERLPFKLVLVNPGSKGENGSRHPSYLEKNPSGTIPTIEEPDTGFTLGEAHAILTYLCDRHGWDDVYPTDRRLRAKVDWYLHFHHRNVRDASPGMVAPKVRKDLDIPESLQASSKATLSRALATLDSRSLADSRFLVGDGVTIADMAAYVEIGQLRSCFTNLYDFSPFPNVQRWLDDMREIREHDVVHIVLSELGDISAEAPSMDAIRNANKAALRSLTARLAELRSDARGTSLV